VAGGEISPPTVASFYKFCSERRLMAGHCEDCGKLLAPPRPLCPNCHSTRIGWKELKGRGRLATYTVIHVAPPQFQSRAPYAVGVIELDEGVRMPGIIAGINPSNLKIGLQVAVDFESTPAEAWPKWPRYIFKPLG